MSKRGRKPNIKTVAEQIIKDKNENKATLKKLKEKAFSADGDISEPDLTTPANLTKQDVLDIIYALQLLAKDHYGKPMGLLDKVKERLNGDN